MKYLSVFLFTSLLTLSGCSYRSLDNSLNITEPPENKATVVFYTGEESFFNRVVDVFSVLANNILMGEVGHGKALVKELNPGTYKVHVKKGRFVGDIREVSEFTFKAGKVYWVQLYLDVNSWTRSIRFMQTDRPEKI